MTEVSQNKGCSDEWRFLKLQSVILTPDALLRKAKQPGEESVFSSEGKADPSLRSG